MPNEAHNTYSIPVAYRKMENLHIVFWLFKDVAWCMVWKPLGIVMIFPTLIISIVIAWRTRQMVSELCHNLAIIPFVLGLLCLAFYYAWWKPRHKNELETM